VVTSLRADAAGTTASAGEDSLIPTSVDVDEGLVAATVLSKGSTAIDTTIAASDANQIDNVIRQV
jgi:hypothetical protein